MKIFLFLLIVPLVLAPTFAHGLVEISGNFGYDKKIFGEYLQNSATTRTYTGQVAWYLLETSGLELNYSSSMDLILQKENMAIAPTNDILREITNQVDNKVFGIGLRQMLLPRGSILVPLISVGYGRQISEERYRYIVYSGDLDQNLVIEVRRPAITINSVFATFSLQLRLTSYLALKGSVSTIFPAFEYDSAKNNLKYLVGLTCFL